MNFIHYIICPSCNQQLRIDGGWRGAVFCCAVYYWGAGNIVGKITIVSSENGTEGMAE